MAATLRQVWQVYKENGCEATVHRTVQTKLGADSDAPDVRAFLDELERLLAEPELLLLMLSIGLGGLYETQASFLGILLREEVLQPKIVDMLLEKLSEFSAEMDAQVMEKNVPKLILRELRWMDLVVDSRQLIEKLLGALPAFSPSLQRDVIYILPELASDEDAAIVVDALLEFIRVDAGLVVCCIEALGNFNVLTEQTADVAQCVLERLNSSPLADLPAIVKYLVQEAPTSDIDAIVDELREKLSSTLAFGDAAAVADASAGGNEEALILGSIIQSFYFREELLKIFVARIQSAGCASVNSSTATTATAGPALRLLDVWVLLGAHSIPKHQDKMGKLVKKKIHTGALQRELLVTSVRGHTSALRALFPSLLQLAALLITHTSDAACVAMGSLLYELLFEEFSTSSSDASGTDHQTAFYQGEVVSALLSHALSRTAVTKNAALDTLRALVAPRASFQDVSRRRDRHRRHHARTDSAAHRRDRLCVFLPALKQLLDAMESCSAAQVRKIYDVLFAIGGAEDADLCTTLRKQAFHQDTRYRCFGIIAAVARTKRLLEFFREQLAGCDEAVRKAEYDTLRATALPSSQAAEVDAQMNKALSRAVTELHESCLAQPKCLAFVLRELELLVRSVEHDAPGRALVDIISEFYADVLLNRFMADFDVQQKVDGAYCRLVLDGAMKTDLWVGLDDRLSPVYLKILSLVASPSLSMQQSLLFLGPLIGLLLTCARHKETLADIECVLVCPIQLMERSVLQDLSALDASVQNAVCLTLWHGVNWLRSILNFFACETSAYHAAKVAERLENLSLLESLLLDEALPASPSFSPPGSTSTVAAAANTTESAVASTAKASSDGKTTTKKAGRPPGKKRLTSLDDRKLAVTQSFVPLKPDVVSILTSPRLQLGVGAVSMDPLPQDAGAAGLDVPLLQILFALLERHVTQSCKRRAAMGFIGTKLLAAAHTAASDDILEHQYELPSARELLETFSANGVLDAAGKFAALILAATERELQHAASDSETPDDPLECASRDARVLEHRCVLIAYLKVVAAAVTFDLGDASAGASDGPDARKMQQLQALILPSNDRIEYSEGDSLALQHIVKKFFKVLIRYHRVVGEDLDFAVALLKCLTAILSLAYGFDAELVLSKAVSIDLNGQQQRRASLSSAIAAKISSLALSFLQKDWTRGDAKFVYKSAHLDVLLYAYLRHSAVVLDSIQTLALDGFLALLEHNGARVASYPTLDKKSVGAYHRAMLSSLVAVTARLDIVDGGSGTASDVAFVFSYLSQAVLLFKLLVCMTKSFQKAVMVASVLKIGRRFLETVLRIMPFLQMQFQLHSARVVKLISELQVATRRMQVLCAHGKLIKDQSAASQVPMVKKLLERLIYRSEELASANGVLDAYTTGVLKNRRIDGTTISKAELEAVSESDTSESEHEEEQEQEDEQQEDQVGEDEEDEEIAEEDAASVRPPTKRRAR